METVFSGTHRLLDAMCNLSSSTLKDCIHRTTTASAATVNGISGGGNSVMTSTTTVAPLSSSSSFDTLIDINDFNGLDYSAVALAVDNFSYSVLQFSPGGLNRTGTNLNASTSNNSSGSSSKLAMSNLSASMDVYETRINDVDFLYRHSAVMTLVYCIAYIIVFIVGLIGNSFVIAVVLRAPRMRTVTNYFIVNLAIADILVIVFCLPATLMSNIFVPWVLGWLMCKTVPYIQGVSVAASVYSLIAVSLDSVVHSPVVKAVVPAHHVVVAH